MQDDPYNCWRASHIQFNLNWVKWFMCRVCIGARICVEVFPGFVYVGRAGVIWAIHSHDIHIFTANKTVKRVISSTCLIFARAAYFFNVLENYVICVQVWHSVKWFFVCVFYRPEWDLTIREVYRLKYCNVCSLVYRICSGWMINKVTFPNNIE